MLAKKETKKKRGFGLEGDGSGNNDNNDGSKGSYARAIFAAGFVSRKTEEMVPRSSTG